MDKQQYKTYKKIGKKKIKEVKPGPGAMSQKLAAFWKDQIEDAREKQKNWIKQSEAITKRYRDDRTRVENNSQRRMNLLWANIQIMKPAIYSQCPTPVVDRKFLDHDTTARLSSQILERALRNEVTYNGLHTVLKSSVLDYLLSGRGQAWVRYEPTIGRSDSIPTDSGASLEDEFNDIQEDFEAKLTEDSEEDDPEEEALEDSGQQVVGEKAICDYIHYKDFYTLPAESRTWAEVQAVCKKVRLSKEEAEEYFTEEIAENIRPDNAPNKGESSYSEGSLLRDINNRELEVYEIWSKIDRRVYWVSFGYEYLCGVKDDPLKLIEFFPCPMPLLATYTNDSLIPVPDFMEWQDQALQIDELTQRIAMLTKACKVAGTYDSSNGALKRLMSESVENELIPVDSWAVYKEKGGVEGSISFLPIREVIQVIETLSTVRREVKGDLDEVTGLSDILRGTTDSRETLGGLRLKNNNAGTRLNDRQNEVARYAKDIVVLMAEVISKHFSDESLIECSGILYEEELQPEAIVAELKASISKQQMQALQQPAPQPQLAPPQQPPMPAPQQMPQQPQTGTNVVPFSGGQPPQQMVPQPPPPPSPEMIDQMFAQQAQQVIQGKVAKAISLLRQDMPRKYRIDIETDSTIFADAMQERQDATEFITATMSFMANAEKLGQGMPEALPLFGKFLQFGVRKFRAGRDLESSIDTFVKQIDKKAKEMVENPPPSPEMMKVQAEMQKTQLDGKIQEANDQRDMQRQQADDERQAQIQQTDDQRRLMMEQAKDQAMIKSLELKSQIETKQIQEEMIQSERDAQYKREEHAFRMEELELKRKERVENKVSNG